MCLVAFAWKTTPEADLVLVGNRDELHARPTAAMDWWNGPDLLAGRDLTAGGTWFGVDRRGRLGVITNLRGAQTPSDPPSRGTLIPAFLGGATSPSAFLEQLSSTAATYAGFTLLLADRDEVAVLTSTETQGPTLLAPGVFALSNGPIGTDWPKIRKSRARLQDRLRQPLVGAADLLALLDDRSTVADQDLPDTGIGLALERRLAPQFIVHPDYGTRSATAILRSAHEVHCVEQHFSPAGDMLDRREFRFRPKP